MASNKLSALASLLLVFASGILVGAVGHRLYMVNSVNSVSVPPRPPRPDPEERRRHLVSEMQTRVKLDDQQVQQLNTIYDRTRQRFDELHQKGSQESRVIWDQQKEEIKAILRPDQVPLYETYQKERDDQHKREMERRQQEGKGPGPR
jgi:hypothetical protein